MVAIGVIGHRALAELDRINAGVAEALHHIEEAFPGQPLTVISSLAEGADRLVVHQALARSEVRLVVPLPLPKSDYLADFVSAESKAEFLSLLDQAAEVIELPPALTRNEAYEAASNYVLEHCDTLIAIWDGQGPQGQGGTGAIVVRARRRGLPIAWVHAGNRHPETQEPTSLGAEQGTVTFEEGAPTPRAPGGSANADGLTKALDELQQAFTKWDEIAVRKARKTTRFGFFTALLGPVAVLLLTVQILMFPHTSPIAVTLIGLELAALLFALIVGFAHFSPSPDAWIHDRLRAEVLRRERHLVAARVGPYLTTPDLASAIRYRLQVIDNDITEPLGLIPLQNSQGRPWRDALEDAGPNTTASPDHQCLQEFYNLRVVDQKEWFAQRSDFHTHRHIRFEDIARVALVLALVVSAMHLILLLTGTHGPGDVRSAWQLVVEIVAIVLPPVGAAATALQSLFEGRRLSRSYGDRARTLQRLVSAFSELQQQMTAPGSKTPYQLARWEFQLKRLVLRTEEVLASELHQWWLLMHS
jgi:hypothetical protein